MADLQIRYQVAKLQDVLNYFIDGFYQPERGRIVRVEWWLDSAKGDVVFRLMLEPSASRKKV